MSSIPTLVRVFLCPCVGPFPSVGLTLTWFKWDRNLALHITLYSVYSRNSQASVSNDGKIPGFVFVSLLFLSSVIKFEKKCANSTQRSQSTLEVDHCLQSQKFTLQDEVIYHQVILSFCDSSYFIIHQRHNFLPILGLILLKLKHASNRPVYFCDLCAAYSALPQKSSRIIFQHTYANLLSSKITQHDKIHKR